MQASGARAWLEDARRHPWQVVALLAPVAFILVAGWTQRWTSDDGFINVRVVHQIPAGNGPVFNAR